MAVAAGSDTVAAVAGSDTVAGIDTVAAVADTAVGDLVRP